MTQITHIDVAPDASGATALVNVDGQIFRASYTAGRIEAVPVHTHNLPRFVVTKRAGFAVAAFRGQVVAKLTPAWLAVHNDLLASGDDGMDRDGMIARIVAASGYTPGAASKLVADLFA